MKYDHDGTPVWEKKEWTEYGIAVAAAAILAIWFLLYIEAVKKERLKQAKEEHLTVSDQRLTFNVPPGVSCKELIHTKDRVLIECAKPQE